MPNADDLLTRIQNEFPDPIRQARVHAMLTGTVFPDADEIHPMLERRIEAHNDAREAVENYCADFYDRKAGINHVYLGYGVLLRFRQIAVDAMIAYDRAFMCGPDCEPPFGLTHGKFNPDSLVEYQLDDYDRLVQTPDWDPNTEIIPLAVAAHRPGERWLIRGSQTFESVAESLSKDIACELEVCSGCCDSLQRRVAEYPRDVGVHEYPPLFPLPHGDFVVFAKVCWQCWRMYKDRYDLGECRIESPFDGIG